MSPPTPADRLASTAPPWVHLLTVGDDALETFPVPSPGIVVRTVDAHRCLTKRALLDELGRALAFPAHFGRNWDALEDCLTDLGWLPARGYWLVVTAADRLLVRDPEGYATFLAVLEDVGRAWGTGGTGHPGREPMPFHTVLMVPADRLGARQNWRATPLGG